MKKIFSLLFITFLLNGCAESVALLGTTAGGASSGKMLQSSIHSAASYGIKKETGKSPLGHVIGYVDKKNPDKKKEPCLSFVQKTNSEVCAIVKKQIGLTKAKIINIKKKDKSLKVFSSSLRSNIDKKSKIKYLD
jgi:hypothetical protein|tara:strand:- start:776 stop:1180 length:405 start_codon:yes stop_codon:yes gene_type:complete